jgi:hypothetical protein
MIYAGTVDIPNAIKRKHFYEGYTETDIAKDIKKEISDAKEGLDKITGPIKRNM